MFTQIEHQFVQNFTNQFPCDARPQLFTQGKDPNKIYFPNKFNSNFNPLQQRKKFQEIKIDSVELDFPCLLLLPMLFSPFSTFTKVFSTTPSTTLASMNPDKLSRITTAARRKVKNDVIIHARLQAAKPSQATFPKPCAVIPRSHWKTFEWFISLFFPLAAAKKKLCHFVPAARWQRTPPVAGGRKFSLILEVVLCLLFFLSVSMFDNSTSICFLQK